MKLRDYQDQTIASVFKYWKESPQKWPLIVLPTAAGKTVVFSSIIKEVHESAPNCRTLVLAHRAELITQAEEKIETVWPGASLGVFAASLNRRELRPITIASRDTIRNALDCCGTFDLVIIDEAHNIAPREETGYQKIIDALRARNPSLMVLGVTATPFRTGGGFIYKDGSKNDKHKIFDDVAHQVKIKTLLDLGYLCRITTQRTNDLAVIHTEGMRTANGDFVIGELEKIAADIQAVRAALNEWQDVAINKQRRKLSLFFCVSVAHAEMVAGELSTMGFNAPIITGKTPKKERDQVIADAKKLRCDALINVGCLTEGTDIPAVDCIVMLRPTKSLGLYVQMIGRGMRLSPETGKADCLLLDYGECVDRFGPIDIAQPPEAKSADKRTKDCPQCQQIIGLYVRKCLGCGFEFAPPPHKICPACETPNAPTAAKCLACNFVFTRHALSAAQGAVLSDEQEPLLLPVNRLSALAMNAPNGGYLQAVYWTPKGPAYKAVLLNAPGLAGRYAQFDWHEMTTPGTPAPRSIAHAAELLNNGHARPARFVKVPQGQPHALIQVIY